MSRLNDEQTIRYLYRSYAAVDGLWFMKVEEKLGFDAALDADREVWRVLPKIQARLLRQLLDAPDGITGLLDCLTSKLTLDGFKFSLSGAPDSKGFNVTVHKCPWMDLLVKSGREHLAGLIGEQVCRTEYESWAAEFGPGISFETTERICAGKENCVWKFMSQVISPE